MFPRNADDLGRKSRYFRYIYFVLSSFSLKSFGRWKREGEQNPFVQVAYRPRRTHQQEIIDIFEDSLRG